MFSGDTLLVAMAAAGQVSATRDEETEGCLDHLLVRPVARVRWLAGRFAVSAAALAAFGISAGLFAWVGAAATGIGQLLPDPCHPDSARGRSLATFAALQTWTAAS